MKKGFIIILSVLNLCLILTVVLLLACEIPLGNGGQGAGGDYDLPAPDYVQDFQSGLNEEITGEHNFNSIPKLVQVWVKSNSQTENVGTGVYTDDITAWKQVGILSQNVSSNSYYGTITEAITTNTIIVRTGNTGLWHGHKDNNYITEGTIRIMAWK